jgi:hypothetical protein
MESEGSLPQSQMLATCLYPEAYSLFRNMIRFYSEELLTPRPTPKLEDHPFSAVPDCLFNIFAATLHTGGRSSIRNLRKRHAVVTGTHLSWVVRLGFGNTCPMLNIYIYSSLLCIMQIRQLWPSFIERK